MGYRDEWLTHEGAICVHSEMAMAAFDREINVRQMRMLLVGIGNGGTVEVWRKTLPTGSDVVAMDIDPQCRNLPGIGDCVITCDVTDSNAVKEALRGQWFDCIIDATGTMSPHTWPFLAPGGTLTLETYDPEVLLTLARDVALRADSWLPGEEVLRVDIYTDVAVVEKCNPIVLPPVRVLTGNFADRIPESVLYQRGIKRALIQ